MADSLRSRFEREMLVRGLKDRTRETYLENLSLMVQEIGKDPRKMTREDLTAYFAGLVKEGEGQASSTVRQKLCAAELFFEDARRGRFPLPDSLSISIASMLRPLHQSIHQPDHRRVAAGRARPTGSGAKRQSCLPGCHVKR